jgi:hypothetical protein
MADTASERLTRRKHELTNKFPRNAPLLDELSNHKLRVDRLVLPFVVDCIKKYGLFRNVPLWDIAFEMLRAFTAMQQGVADSHLWVGRAFDTIDRELATHKPEALLMLCIMQPCFMWHLQGQIPRMTQLLGIYIDHIADLSLARIGEQHPITSLMLGLKHIHHSAVEHWAAFTAPLLREVDTELMREPQKTHFSVILTQICDETLIAPLFYDVIQWDVQTRQTAHIARGLGECAERTQTPKGLAAKFSIELCQPLVA